ncbi:MAG: metallophosphoesterase [Nitrospirae bacterium]|nr:metallophosphoesterase [Nitrospirota bacterium]
MSEITILHLSDLHMEKSNLTKPEVVMKALFEDLKRLRNNEDLKPDLVFFTGDLVKDGSKDEEFKRAKEEFITPLMKTLGLSEDCFFLVPGNHDIDRDKQNQNKDTIFYALYKNKDERDKFFDNNKMGLQKGKYMEALHYFTALKNTLDYSHIEHKENNMFSVYKPTINGVKLGIGCLNSAWLSCGAKFDKKELIVGERQVDWVFEEIRDCSIKIALMHHHIEDLTPLDGKCVKDKLRNNFDWLFTGHLHMNKLEFREGPQPYGKLFHSVAGELSEDSEGYYQGYTILKFDLQSKQNTKIHKSKYRVSCQEFLTDTDADSNVVDANHMLGSNLIIASAKNDPRRTK